MIILIGLTSFKFFSVPLSSSYLSERCKPTTKGVHPPSFQGQLISFHSGVVDLSLQQETKKKGRHDWFVDMTDSWTWRGVRGRPPYQPPGAGRQSMGRWRRGGGRRWWGEHHCTVGSSPQGARRVGELSGWGQGRGEWGLHPLEALEQLGIWTNSLRYITVSQSRWSI